MRQRVFLPALLLGLSLVVFASAQEPTTGSLRVPADERPRLQAIPQRPYEGVQRTPSRLYYNGAFYQRVDEPANPYSANPYSARLLRVGSSSAAAKFALLGQSAYALRPTTAPMPTGYQYGRGIIGQPKLYVPRQPVRNLLRFITP